MTKQVIVIGGPTASGKTKLAVDLGLCLDAEIINADSRQVYDELNIGVAKPNPEELAAVPHHLVSHVSILQNYSAGTWAKEAKLKIEEIFTRKDFCIISGGSGLHVKALLEGMPEMPNVPLTVRDEFQKMLDTKGKEALACELEKKDPEYYAIVDRENPARLMRALSLIKTTGKTFTSFRNAERQPLNYPQHWILINPERELLYKRIEKRIDLMLEAGLEKEARSFYSYRNLDALATIGYQEWWPYFEDKASLSDVVEKIKRNTRRYAKRQLTWNRKIEGLLVNSKPNAEEIVKSLKLNI